ncbi:unnamed protein product [Prunus armeniaca]
MGRSRGVSNPMHAELLALREGLRFATRWQGRRICLESDAQGMITSSPSWGGHLSPWLLD